MRALDRMKKEKEHVTVGDSRKWADRQTEEGLYIFSCGCCIQRDKEKLSIVLPACVAQIHKILLFVLHAVFTSIERKHPCLECRWWSNQKSEWYATYTASQVLWSCCWMRPIRSKRFSIFSRSLNWKCPICLAGQTAGHHLPFHLENSDPFWCWPDINCVYNSSLCKVTTRNQWLIDFNLQNNLKNCLWPYIKKRKKNTWKKRVDVYHQSSLLCGFHILFMWHLRRKGFPFFFFILFINSEMDMLLIYLTIGF